MSENIETPESAPNPADKVKEDPSIVGQLTPDEWNTVVALNHQHSQMVREVGALEVRKAKLLGAVEMTDRQLHQEMQKIGQRLRIPNQLAWNVWGDGEGNGFARLAGPPVATQGPTLVPNHPEVQEEPEPDSEE